ncbi:MAG TPA: response regulator transcription factor [Polyangiales bacterium]|jgi:DNA-binding response OmpR family regulator|nr:response regulator transcription factor [Polyangiales bacterium]
MNLRALLIDDDLRLAELLGEYFAPHGVELVHARDGKAGLAKVEQGGFDVALLDLTMPGMDGLEVCRRIREHSRLPIVMLTARGDETDRVVGLELGADDYLPKPFSPRELLARMRAVLRRASPAAQEERLRVRDLEIDLGARTATLAGRAIELTGLELDLLVALARRAGRVVPRDALFSLAGRSDTAVGDRTVDVHISHLRQKLGDDSRAPTRIRTVRGVGYLLVKDEA